MEKSAYIKADLQKQNSISVRLSECIRMRKQRVIYEEER